jgi:AcrR family transcriptional regulator
MSEASTQQTDVRGRILDATFALVVEEGLGAVTMTRIADRADVARQTLYNHFADVEQIVVAGIEEYNQNGFAHLLDLLEASESPVTKLDLLVRHAVSGAAHGRAVSDIRSALSPSAQTYLDRHTQSFRMLIESIIEAGIESREFDSTIDPAVYAALVEGALLAGAELAGARDDAARVATATSDALLRLLRRG